MTLNSEMHVRWYTISNRQRPAYVHYASNYGVHKVKAECRTYSFSTFESGCIYSTTLQNLHDDTLYYYSVVLGDGDDAVHSQKFHFHTFANAPLSLRRSLVLGVTADLGAGIGGETVLHHMRKYDGDALDALLIAGDVSYSNGDASASPHNGWDHFEALLAPISAFVPLIVAQGNHDADFGENMVPFNARVASARRRAYFAVRVGAACIVLLSAEQESGERESTLDDTQMRWLRRTLEDANRQRAQLPWLIVVAHRPLYNSCPSVGSDVRLRAQLAPLFDEFSVNLYIAGHEHVYERTHPLRDGRVEAHNGTTYVIVAAERRGLKRSLFSPTEAFETCYTSNVTQPHWSAFRDDSMYGYARLLVDGGARLQWQYLHTDPRVGEGDGSSLFLMDSFEVKGW